jgi:uncharacterized membrane-anchored protein
MRELIALWTKMLGTPPSDEQFVLWTALHTEEVVRLAILKTAAKNLSLGKTMNLNYKIRFASKIMLVQSQRNVNNATNREKLRQEFEIGDTKVKEISEKADDGVTFECE